MQTVGDVMRRGLITCKPEASIVAVARTMAAHRIHCDAFALSTEMAAAALARPAPHVGETDSLTCAASSLPQERATHASSYAAARPAS